MTETQVLQAFERIRVWQQGDRRAPHKPLLILLALGRLQRGEPPVVEFSQIDKPLKDLIDQFGPSGSGKNRNLPFWHLGTDDDGRIWRLSGPAMVINRPRGTSPNLGELRRHHIEGGFAPEVLAAFQRDRSLMQEVAHRILDAHFPATIHADILEAVGLSMLNPPKARTQTEEYRRQTRDPTFRDRVLRSYGYRCCVCGYDLRLGQQTIGLEAAHIKWFQAGGPDIEKNGLALCALHHKIFDLGAFTVEPKGYRVIFSQLVSGHDQTGRALLARQGAEILHPQSDDYLPGDDFLLWHQEQVFKKPARNL